MKIVVPTIWLLVLIVSTFAQQSIDAEHAVWENNVGKSRWLTYHLERDDVVRLKARWKEVEDSLANESDAYAAPYFQYGFMSGYFLNWSPIKGFVYVEYFDVEHPCYFSYGNVRRHGAEIRFEIEYETTKERCPGNVKMPLRWIPGDGGKYFVPVSEAKRFGEFYSGRGEFNGFFIKWKEDFPFARRSQNFTPKSMFVLPPMFQHLIRRPIAAKVTWVGKRRVGKYPAIFNPFWDKSSLTPVRIDAGSRAGVKTGTEFVLLDENGAEYQTLKVTRVHARSSLGIVVRMVDDKGTEGYYSYDETRQEIVTKPFTPIQLGVQVTTSPISKLD